MKFKKIIPILIAALLITSIAGCGNKEASSSAPVVSESPAAQPTEPPETDAPAGGDSDSAENLFALAYASHSPDETVMTIDGVDISWARFYHWLYTAVSSLEKNYEITDWNADSGFLADASYQEFALMYARENLTQEVVLDAKQKELGISLSDDAQAEIDAYFQELIDTYGEETVNDILAGSYITREYHEHQLAVSYLTDGLLSHYMGDKGKNVSDEDAVAYIEDNGFMHAKHILFMTVDDSNAPLSDEDIAQKRAQAEDILSQLKSCPEDSLAEKFDELMAEYSEDPGSKTYPSGYYFVEGEMVEPFENAAKELEVGQISDIVESSFGFHILYRPAVAPDDIVSSSYAMISGATVRYLAATAFFSNMVREWMDAATVEYSDIYNSLDFNELFIG